MHYAFTAEQQQVREAARSFAQQRLAEHYLARAREPLLDRPVVAEMGALGLIAPVLPEALGGLALDWIAMGALMEEIARADLSYSFVPLLNTLNGSIIAQHAAPDVAAEWVPRLCRGEALSALALTEPHAGSDAAHISLRARVDGDTYILDGEKTSISLAHQADVAVVFARTGTPEDGAHGITALLVPLDQPGIQRTCMEDVGLQPVGRGSIFFEGVRVPATHRLGSEGRGFTQVMQGFDFSRTLIGLQCLASAAASLEETWRYVSEREAFGSPLARFEGVSFPLAEAETQLEAARLLCYKALWLKQQGLPHTREAAMCKWWGPQLAYEVIHQCLLLHGHTGYGRDTPHQQRLRDVLGGQIGDGTAQVMKIVIAREQVGRVAVPY